MAGEVFREGKSMASATPYLLRAGARGQTVRAGAGSGKGVLTGGKGSKPISPANPR